MNTDQKIISFVPRALLTNISTSKLEERFQAVVAFADVSGFTKMSEQLATIGKEGAEALTGILNNYFTEMIRTIECTGGFVGKFGGDAMTIFFPIGQARNKKQVVRRAVAACLMLQQKMDHFQGLETKAGKFSLGMKIGMTVGEVLYKVVGQIGQDKCEYLLAGKPLDDAAEAEHHGTSGEVVVCPKIAALEILRGEEVADGFWKVEKLHQSVRIKEQAGEPTVEPGWTEIAKSFIDPAIFQRMGLGMDSVGEIRRVSVIFISFRGLDYDHDSGVGGKLTELYAWVYNTVFEYGGSINKIDMGDKGSKIIITFGAPTAHENDEELAVRCGLSLIGGLERMIRIGIEQRMGIASGVVFAGEVGGPTRQEYTVMGSVVNLSARIMAHSHPGQLLVDESTYTRAQAMFEFAEPKYVQFKGMSEPMPVFEATGLKSHQKDAASSSLKPLVGRKHEFETAHQILTEVQEQNLRILIVTGEPGIGKSRLALEIISAARTRKFQLSGGEALSYAKKTPYLLWNSILRRLMGLPAAGGGQGALDAITKILQTADPENLHRMPIIANFLGINCPDNDVIRYFDAQLRQENFFDFILQYFKFLATQNPLAILMEDVQWIDKNSLELISYLIRNLVEFPVLFLLVRRAYSTKFQSPYISEIEGHSTASHIALSELSRDETEQFIVQALEANQIEVELMDFIFASSHGNASFIEQLISHLQSLEKIKIARVEGILVVKKVGDLKDVEVPDSLNSLIMSQLDRLSAESKLTVRVAAAIGRQFQTEVVTKSYPVEMTQIQIDQTVSELKDRDIINESFDADLYDYIFKNLLTRDVAYDSLLFSHRREYHKRIGYCLEELYHDSLTEWYEELARHFSQSEDDEKAVKYLGKAGDKAFDIYANESALEYYTDALERTPIDKTPQERYFLMNMRSKVYSTLGKGQEQKQDLDELLTLTEILGNSQNRVNVLSNLARYYQRINSLDEMKVVIDEALEILNRIDFPFGRITINSKMGSWYFTQNKYQDALRYWTLCQQEAEQIGDKKGLSVALSNCGLAYRTMGEFDRALEFFNQSVKIDREISNKKSEAVTLGNIGVIYHQRGDLDRALEAYKETLDIARSIGSKQILTYYLGNLATIYQAKGERERALNSHQEVLKLAKQMAYYKGQMLSQMNIGVWYQEYGDFEQAVSYFDEALNLAQRLNINAELPIIKLNMGLALHYQNSLPEAQKILNEAVEAAIKVKNRPAEDYSRRYLGFVLIDLNELTGAEEQFLAARDIAQSINFKTSLASVKIGLGLIEMIKGGDRQTIDEGLAEARQLGDKEILLKGLINLARQLIARDQTEEAEQLLNSAAEVAEKSGYRCDLEIIHPLLDQISAQK